MTKPFDGAISTFYEKHAPADMRASIDTANKKDIVDPKGAMPLAREAQSSGFAKT